MVQKCVQLVIIVQLVEQHHWPVNLAHSRVCDIRLGIMLLTLSDLTAQSSCQTCPMGNYCPNSAQVNPVICTGGSVCDADGLPSPTGLCPAGYYCPEGTLTFDVNSTVLARPYPCPKATFCLAGVRQVIQIPGDPTTPQTCLAGTYCDEASTSPGGSGACPEGYYCPTGVSQPIPAPAGTFCNGTGNPSYQQCFPGTYSRMFLFLLNAFSMI